jgi:hypothetical protein
VRNLPIEKEEKDRCRAILRQIGTPTVFRINLPSGHASDCSLRELLCDMMTDWLYFVAHQRKPKDPFDFTFSTMKPLPPEHICGYFHPRRIKGMKQDDSRGACVR